MRKTPVRETVDDSNLLVFPSHAAFEDSIALAVEQRLEERLAELELGAEDAGWTALNAEQGMEFSRAFLRKICRQSRLFFLKNPLVNRAVTIQAMYVFGQGMSITARDRRVQAVIDAFNDDDDNDTELTSHQALMQKEHDLQVEGNLFFALFTDAKGDVKVRTLPVDEVEDIITDPDDMKRNWYYKRVAQVRTVDMTTGNTQTKERVTYHPDYKYHPDNRPGSVGDAPILWDAPVKHVKVGGLSSMRFGVPETYAALDWALAHKAFLEDWATIVRAYRRFAFQVSVPGDKRAVQGAKAKFNTTLASGGMSAETNPPPGTGSIFIAGKDQNLQPVRTSGATVSAQDGRELRLQVCAALGLPETFFGDADVGNYATAKTLDRPTELKFRDRQTLWADIRVDILQYAVDAKLKAKGKLPEPKDPIGSDPSAAADASRVAVVAINTPDTLDRTIDARFPPILHHDMKEWVTAIVQAITLDGKEPITPELFKLGVRMLLTALGEDDVDSQLAAIFPTTPGEPSPGIDIKPKTPPAPPTPPGQQPETPPPAGKQADAKKPPPKKGTPPA